MRRPYIQRKGGAFLWCSYCLRGKECRESTRTYEWGKAEKFLKRPLCEREADLIGARRFIGPERERLKMGPLLDALAADYRLNGKESPQFRSRLKHLREYFGAWRAVEITAEAVDRYIAEKQEVGSPDVTINRCTQLLYQAFRLAIERRDLSTAPKIRHLSESDNARQRFFSETEIQVVRANLPAYLRNFARFGLRADCFGFATRGF